MLEIINKSELNNKLLNSTENCLLETDSNVYWNINNMLEIINEKFKN